MSTRLTPPMRQILADIRDGKPLHGPGANAGNPINYFNGGRAAAITSLRKRGLITGDIPPKLTRQGEDTLKTMEGKTQ